MPCDDADRTCPPDSLPRGPSRTPSRSRSTAGTRTGLADWWADALGWRVEPSNEAFIRMNDRRGTRERTTTATHHGVLVWREGAVIVHPDGPDRTNRVYFQAVPKGKGGKNRLHLDVSGGGLAMVALGRYDAWVVGRTSTSLMATSRRRVTT
ncbi:MAG: VOC family protein [Mycobacteriales bacterium]